jgi:hypothetical protein
MVAAVPYRLSGHGDHGGWDHGTPTREVLAAWIVALLLLAGALISFALDQMVTVSADPVATYGSALKADESGNDHDEPGSGQDRDVKDPRE